MRSFPLVNFGVFRNARFENAKVSEMLPDVALIKEVCRTPDSHLKGILFNLYPISVTAFFLGKDYEIEVAAVP